MVNMARWQSTIVDAAGDVQPLALITVRRDVPGQPLAVLKPNRDGSGTLANPFNADAEGFAAFHVAGGPYQIIATLGGFSRTLRYVALGTAAELDEETILAAAEAAALNNAVTTTPYNSDPFAGNTGYFGDFECASAALFALTQAEVQAADELGGIRTAQTIFHYDNDGTDYEALGYRTISDGLRVGMFGKYSAGTYQETFKDLHGITAVAIGRVGWVERATTSLAGDSVQYGEGVCLNEVGVFNYAAANAQSGHMAGWLAVLAGKKAAADGSHFVRGFEVINTGKLASAAFEGVSLGTDGDNGHYDYLLKGNSATVGQGAILMPASAATNIGTWIVYDPGDLSEYDRAANAFGWFIGATKRLSLTSAALTPGVSGGLTFGTAALPFGNGFLASAAKFDFGNGDWIAQHSAGIVNVTVGDLRMTTPGSNASSVAVVGGGWTAWVPTVTTTGALPTAATLSAAYRLRGKTINFAVSYDVTTLGPGAGTFSFTLPTGTVARDFAVSCYNNNAAAVLYCAVRTADNRITFVPGTLAANKYIMSGTIEIT